jgi:rhodanese-related sulfurtransferase
VALLLRKQGIRRIRPLQGGLDAWRKLGYPVQKPFFEAADFTCIEQAT